MARRPARDEVRAAEAGWRRCTGISVEFGLIETPKGVKIYGAGISSSKDESIFALEDPSPNRIRFDLERVMRTRYRIDDFQQTYFVIRSYDELFRATVDTDFAPLYERLGDGVAHGRMQYCRRMAW